MRAFQVAVALVDKMQLQKGRTAAEQAEVFAKSLHNTWGVGDATCNSGLVLFLSRDDRQVCQNVNKAGSSGWQRPDLFCSKQS